MLGYRRRPTASSLSLAEQRFGVRSLAQLGRDLSTVATEWLAGRRFQFDLASAGLLRGDLSLPAYAGLIPEDGLAPIYNLFDRRLRVPYATRVSRGHTRDFRGGKLSYDDHDGVDFVCPPGVPVVAAAPGVALLVRDRWLRGGLTLFVDHGGGLVTAYAHLGRVLVETGQRVRRGEPIALSGTTGYDLAQFFPWVPPHVHFCVWLVGRPVDPYRTADEADQAGTWTERNTPLPGVARDDDPEPGDLSPVDPLALERVALACTDPQIREEIARASTLPAALAILLEDALAHDPWAFPASSLADTVRPRPPDGRAADQPVATTNLRLSLPLGAPEYRGARFADTALTRP